MQTLDPDLPVIIICRLGGEKEWAGVLESGAFDLLVAPYQASKLAESNIHHFHQMVLYCFYEARNRYHPG